MTDTRRWLEARRAELLRREGLAGALVTVGLVALGLGLGVWLGRLGVYRVVPEAVLVGWAVAVAGLAGGVWLARRATRRVRAEALAREVERQGGLRRGTVGAFARARDAVGSAALSALADRRAAGWLDEHGARAFVPVRHRHARAVRRGAAVALAGVTLFTVSDPAQRHAGFWTPLTSIARARGPVRVTADRTSVGRGDTVAVTIVARGRRAATLHTRSPGEPWREQPLALDSAGSARVALGPLTSDRFVRAASGGRASDTLHIRVAVPGMVTDLSLLARYPAYLGLADEPLVPGPDAIILPVGTGIVTRGRASVALSAARWDGTRGATLDVSGSTFSGILRVAASGRWQLTLETADGTPLEGVEAGLTVTAVPDSAPVLAIPVPGADTTAPVSLRQPLVVDVRDDHRVTRVEVVSRRVSRLGVAGEPRTEPIPLPGDGVERAVLQWLLDLNERGFLPGDTARFRVRAWDNAPDPHMVASREYALRLPSMADLRAAARTEGDALAAAADSLAERQRELQRATEELGAEGRREGGDTPGRTGEPLDYRATERAGEVAGEQTAVMERARELQDRLRELSDAAWEAGITDPEWHKQLEELQQLLERALTPELEEAMRALQEAMAQLDPARMQEALERLAEAQRRLREALERSRTLFERAAIEGDLTTLAADAEELAARQEEWNRAAGRQVDSSLAAQEAALAEQADSLAANLEALEQAMGQADSTSTAASSAGQARSAEQQMQQAAQAASQGDQQRAQRAGQQAAGELGPLADRLRQQRDELRDQWRAEVLEAMDHALIETAQLARRQDDIRQRLERGETGPDVRAEQAAVRDGVDRVIERLRAAAGRNALVSPRLAAALGLAKLKMTGAVDLLQRANPNVRGAQNEAGEALDGLNAVAYQLLRSRSDVASAASGSGLQEAIERMAQMAQQQQGLANQAGGMLPLMQQGGEMLMQELRRMAMRQRQLAEQLERMRNEGVGDGTDQLAEEARDLARQLEQGVLDRSIVERQERLFRRLLDQGRSLRGTEQKEDERVSEAAKPGNLRLPEGSVRSGEGPRFRYPSWEELQRLSPEERRLILDYFRRLNERRGGNE